jgi:glycosyltransferase involved in cell wall biosynthesis
VRPACSDDELERLLAVSRALVAPSLEEGYGLPAFEAASAGLPVAASRTGAMTELPAESAVLFDPSSTDEMTRAIDEVTRRPVRPSATIAGGAFREPILTSLDRALGDREAAH